MNRQFEYLEVMVQSGKATYVNGEWIGTIQPNEKNSSQALASCQHPWQFLRDVGSQGWELVAAVMQQTDRVCYQILYLKRELVYR